MLWDDYVILSVKFIFLNLTPFNLSFAQLNVGSFQKYTAVQKKPQVWKYDGRLYHQAPCYIQYNIEIALFLIFQSSFITSSINFECECEECSNSKIYLSQIRHVKS